MYMLPYRENIEERMGNSSLILFINTRSTPGEFVSEHWHPCLELLYILEGEAVQTIADRKFIMHQGDTALVAPSAVHATSAVSYNCRIAVIQFICDEPIDSYYLPAEGHMDIEKLLLYMRREVQNKETGWEFIVRGMLYQTLGMLRRKASPIVVQYNVNEEGQALEEYIRENLADNPTLQSVADFAGYTPTYFSRYFSQMMGMPFKQYVDHLKMQAARGMLNEGETTASIAAALGYTTPSAFCRAFKRLTGHTPSECSQEKPENIRSEETMVNP